MIQDVELVYSQGQWLALADGVLIAAGDSFDELWEACCIFQKS